MDPVTAAIDTDHDGILSSTEIARASASLAKLDRNGDGQLTEDELRPNFGPGGMPRDPSQMVERMFQEFDRNGDGKLAKSEVPGRLQEMFDSADADKDGFLSRDELKKAIEQGGMFPGGPGPGRMRREGGRPE
jgi:Ca2+-binding EF-hand superfamily protein